MKYAPRLDPGPFTPRQNEGDYYYNEIQQLHIAEGLRRSYNDSG